MENKQQKPTPDIASMINSIIANDSNPDPKTDDSEKAGQVNAEIGDENKECRLWAEFTECLKASAAEERATRKLKLYAIDSDIVKTLNQCDFQASNVRVINSIIRTFLIDNVENLKKIQKTKVESILDKYA